MPKWEFSLSQPEISLFLMVFLLFQRHFLSFLREFRLTHCQREFVSRNHYSTGFFFFQFGTALTKAVCLLLSDLFFKRGLPYHSPHPKHWAKNTRPGPAYSFPPPQLAPPRSSIKQYQRLRCAWSMVLKFWHQIHLRKKVCDRFRLMCIKKRPALWCYKV